MLKFLGIPIDGGKKEVISKLTELGFQKEYGEDILTGIFNGENVKLQISTNHGIVDRIIVEYPSTSSNNDTRIKYNTLLSRFNRNAKYVSLSPRAEIPVSENLALKLHDNSKYYDAAYFFLQNSTNTEDWKKYFAAEYCKRYSTPFESISYEELEEALFCLPKTIRSAINGIVWFTITDVRHIAIYYDNLHNRPHGEDL